MSNARKLAANLPKEGQFSGRNLIINGAMEVAQRGTSQSAAGFGSVDRMSLGLSGGTGTMSQQYMTVSDKATTGFAHYLRLNLTSGKGSSITLLIGNSLSKGFSIIFLYITLSVRDPTNLSS